MTEAPREYHIDPARLHHLRVDYATRTLQRDDLADDPHTQFAAWFDDAIAAQVPEPNLMTLATSTPDGRPSARALLLKGVDRGFLFFTSYDSRKGQELAANPHAALAFLWYPVQRQILVRGTVERVSADESTAYFNSRPWGSRISALASEQSRPIGKREELEQRAEALKAQYPEQPGDVPRPGSWGGYRLVADEVEFWQGRASRLHDRFVYCRGDDGEWTIERLQP